MGEATVVKEGAHPAVALYPAESLARRLTVLALLIKVRNDAWCCLGRAAHCEKNMMAVHTRFEPPPYDVYDDGRFGAELNNFKTWSLLNIHQRILCAIGSDD